jgi:hypothetical protein
MKVSLIFLFLCAAILAADCGCDDPDFDSPSVIQSQRFLGIKADPLEAAPGENVTFSALVVDSDGSTHEGPIMWMIGADNDSSEEGAQDVVFYETEESGPFVWTVPEKNTLEEAFGPMGENGILMTVFVGSFPAGDPSRDPITTYKMFVVSERSEAERMANPVIDEVKVTTWGDTLSMNEDGEYLSDDDTVKIRIVPESGESDLTFHWFSVDKDFESEMESVQEVKTDGRSLTQVYCVVRKEYYFIHDEVEQTRMTGMDWVSVPIRHEYSDDDDDDDDSADADDDDSTDDDDCIICETSSECFDVMGQGWACIDGCCQQVD